MLESRRARISDWNRITVHPHARPLGASLLLAWLCLALPLASLAADPPKPGSGKIIKWVDDKGITHYGDTIPTQDSGRSNTTINSQGMVIRRSGPGNAATPSNSAPAIDLDHARRDRALLASYTTEQEIDLARDRNLEMDQIILEGLQQRQETATNQLNSLNQTANTIKSRNKPVPADVAQDIQEKTAEIGRINSQIKQRQDNMAAIRKRFEHDKKRFNALKNGAEPGSAEIPVTPAAALPAPNPVPAAVAPSP